jgi:hypothetical protein
MANRYCVYWYRYNKGHIDEEGLVEDGWERIKPGDYVYNTNSTDSYNIMGYNTGVPLQYKVVDGQVRYVPKAASAEGVVQVYLQPNKEVEKFKIVLFYNHERFESNVLEFTNLDEIPPEVIIDPSDVI